ncbi:MAG TPA: type II toxin-antitoxin system HipA family toxin YjjJ [Albitalea sp.]|uniref:type II toxin-antitoxin system HipA family toxin YjjJ n=1 Tax=Piscinibacter sp. TaxID=1903157 RepID=UPI002ED51BA6
MAIDLVPILRTKGRQRAGDIVNLLGISRPTLSRAVKGAGDRVVSRGNARRVSYAARRPLRGSMAPLPLYRLDASGIPREIARLDLTHPNGSAVEFLEDFGWPLDDEMRDGWFDGLPYTIQDMRPQGFLGRSFARRHAALLQVSEDPTTWSDDDALQALTLLGMDGPGDLIVGESACRLWLEQVRLVRTGAGPDGLRESEIEEAYPRLAAIAMGMGVAGSSAGGEFPKFTALRQPAKGPAQHVLVKFSGSDDSPGTQRWADLLVCEHLAGRVLREHLQTDAAVSRIYRLDGRTFLEVDRFDRHGILGRSGLTSWMSLNAAFFGMTGRAWSEAVRQLAHHGWLDPDDVARIDRLWFFGQLIANTDMHDGNLSFQPRPLKAGAGLRVAPAYDMLPMLYAPVRGVELPERAYEPRMALPAHMGAWRQACAAAITFWALCAGDKRISAAFRNVCSANAETLRRLAG